MALARFFTASRYRALPAPVRVAVYLLGVGLASLAWGAGLFVLLRPGPDVLLMPERYPWAFNAYMAGSYAILVGGALGLWRYAQAGSWADLGLLDGHWARRLGEGALWGLASLDGLFALALARGWLLWDAAAWAATPLAAWGLALASATFFGLSEELLFRGFVLQTLRRGLPGPLAIGATGLLFASVHFLRADLHWADASRPFLGLLLAGCLLGWLALRTGSIYLGSGLHAAWVAGFLITDRQKLLIYPMAYNGLTGGGYPLGGLLGYAMLLALAIALAMRLRPQPGRRGLTEA